MHVPISALASPHLQTKLRVGAPDDMYEAEAERVAEQILRMPVDRGGPNDEEEQAAIPPPEEMDEEQVDRGGNSHASPATHAPLQPGSAGGEALPGSLRAYMEPRFGYDFSQVRLHTDPQAGSLANNLGARAFTVGREIFFGNGEYQPGSSEGRRLLAHELTHVVQQDRSGASLPISPLNERRVQRYLVGPPQRIDAKTQTGPTYGACRNFNWVVNWDTSLRNGHIIQECTNRDTITGCDGVNQPAPNIPHYWEAWEVDAAGNISDGNADTWFRAGRPSTKGRWTFDANVFAVGALDPAWGFKRNSVGTAGGLLATTTGPSHDDLYQPSMTRHAGGEWDCCIAAPYHRPI